MNDITIFIFDAQAGMKLSRDIILSDGSMLAPKDTVLTPSLIAKISSLHVLEINIYNEEEDSTSQAERNAASINADKENTNYYEKVRNSEEYKHFESEYNHNVDSVKYNLNSFLTSDESIDTDSMVSDTMNIVSEARNSLQMFDMLHAMRNKDDLTYVHSVNVAFIASIIGKWLNFSEEDIKILTLAGLLHDIGKALDREFEGSHVDLGVEYARKYKENENVVHAIQAHHGDVEAKTVVACLVQAADAISAARPGARRENVENYIKRLEKLEEIATSFEGVEKSFAIQAGREIRIMVKPEVISDDQMALVAREVVKKIEDELEYPGQIKVNIIRENRTVDYAK